MRGYRKQQNDVDSLAQRFSTLKNEYSAAKLTRYRRRRSGISLSGSGADYHYRSESDYLRMMEYARDMDRNDAIVGQIVDRAVANIVQDGIRLDTQVGDPAIDADLMARWQEWSGDSEQCDLSGELSFYDMEWLVLRSMMVDGDCIALPNKGGALQLIEAHRLRTPRNTTKNVILGVLLDAYRRRLEYWFTKDDIDPLTSLYLVSDVKAYKARDAEGNRQVFHIYDPKRMTQTRGVTAFAPIFDTLGMFEDINFAKLVQQQIVSCFAIFRMRDLAFDGAGTMTHGEADTETLSDGTTRTIEGIAPGMEISGAPGERLEGFSPSVPNEEFFSHVKLILTLVGVNLGLPLALVLLDASETNFSGWRGAVDQARLGFRRKQQHLIGKFHKPVYLWKVGQWLAEDTALRNAYERGINVFAHKWHPPTWPYIEPLKDAGADLLRVRNGLISPRRLHAERGREWQEIASEIVADNSMAIQLAIEAAERINAIAPEGQRVHWREIISLPTPDGVQVNATAATDTSDNSDGTDA